jgi:ribonuclease P protein component
MLKKTQRVPRELFTTVGKQGSSLHASHVSAKILVISRKQAVFSFVVSKKVAPTAAARNLLKRRGRHAVADFLTRRGQKNIAVIFFFKPGAAELPAEVVVSEISQILDEAYGRFL